VLGFEVLGFEVHGLMTAVAQCLGKVVGNSRQIHQAQSSSSTKDDDGGGSGGDTYKKRQ
jgi:hypothetical protein